MQKYLVKNDIDFFYANLDFTGDRQINDGHESVEYRNNSIVRIWNNGSPLSQSRKQAEYLRKFHEVIAFIDEHYAEDICLEEIAHSIGFSKYHFSRLFKQYTNYTFCDYLNFRRVKAAENLLAQKKLPVTEIALCSGFSSISTFNRLFRQFNGCSPSEYRAQKR